MYLKLNDDAHQGGWLAWQGSLRQAESGQGRVIWDTTDNVNKASDACLVHSNTSLCCAATEQFTSITVFSAITQTQQPLDNQYQ
ncbi:hypothetical protein E2C01_008818 [Portunus trituberculatus]|uniref:Uncharacterized protein n=1 Tax=Portunus trituberculatus TaxID=210409 RepID=A0A5B7D3Z4_PORTR|nr:hypothetical protein [Portunus trituberculatus]